MRLCKKRKCPSDHLEPLKYAQSKNCLEQWRCCRRIWITAAAWAWNASGKSGYLCTGQECSHILTTYCIYLAKISRFGEREKGSLSTAWTSNETAKGAYQKYN